DSETSQLQEFKTRIDAAEGQKKKLLEEAADLTAAPMLRTAWVALLDEVSQLMPARNIWITSLRPMSGDAVLQLSEKQSAGSIGDAAGAQTADDQNGQAVTGIAIDGLYLENEGGPAVVDAFVDSLVQSDLFAIDPEKKNDAVKLRSAQTGETWAYEYKLVLPLKRPIPL
ncbi:MAG: hypothetical protein RIQ71_1758, partial [Verrucomicrobiota bacterium]